MVTTLIIFWGVSVTVRLLALHYELKELHKQVDNLVLHENEKI